MSVLTPGASVFVKAFRVSALTEEGAIAPGATTVTTKDGMKCNITPVMDTGDDIAVKNAKGDLATLAKHGDMIKYYTVQLELAKPDPQIEQLCCGGSLIGSSAAALGEPGAPTVTPQNSGGSLAKGFYGYRLASYNVFGESKANAEVLGTEALAATENTMVVLAGSFPAGSTGVRVFGRAPGAGQFIGVIPNIATPKLKKAVAAKAAKKGTPFVIEVEAVTVGIPGGTTFKTASAAILQVVGYVAAGASTATVELINETENAAEIKAENLKPLFYDTGAVTPSGAPKETDTTGGPGENIGYQAPALGPVANENGVGIEAWSYCYVEGQPATTQPFWWWVFPRVRYMHIMPRDLTNANAVTIMEGIAIGNPNWGTGPTGEWPETILKASQPWQRIRCGGEVIPTPSYTPVAATV